MGITSKKILITGANGFIGSNLSNYLLNKGYKVTCIVRENAKIDLLNKNLDICFCDYNNKDMLNDHISKHNVIIHMAGLTKANSFNHLYNTNVLLTEDIVDIVNNSTFVDRFIFISSQAAVGPSVNNTPKNITDKQNPISWYGISKYLAEKQVLKCNKDTTIIRPASVYGEADKDFLSYFRLVNYNIALIPASTKYISLIYINDLIKIIENHLEFKNSLVHASDTEIYTIEEFVTILSSVMNKKCLLIKIKDEHLKMFAKFQEFIYGYSDKTCLLNEQKALELSQQSWLLKSTETFISKSNLYENLMRTYTWYKKNNYL